MFPAFLLALREGMEIALVLGIVLGALHKTRRADLSFTVWSGAGSAAVLSVLAAMLLQYMGTRLEGRAEELFEGLLMLIAAGVLTWMIFWMQRQSRQLRGELEAGVRRATSPGAGRWALFSLAFVAVLREGIELALFLAATAAATNTTAQPLVTLSGAVLGLACAAVLGWALFAATVRLNLRAFFQVTSLLLILFAAGLVAHGVHELNEARLIPSMVEHVWDVNGILDEDSTAGSLLTTMFGYNGNPSLSEVLAYSLYLVGIGFLLWRKSPSRLVSQGA